MPYNDEPAPSVDLRIRPVLYTHDEKPVYRAIGFAPAPARGVQTTGTFPALSTPTRRKPKGKGKGR